MPNGRHRFESLFVYGFPHPGTGRSRFSIRPKANAECMGQALADFAGWADPDGRKVLVVVVDGSGGHTAKKLAVPPNVVLHRQPSCTPEFQPAEHLQHVVVPNPPERVRAAGRGEEGQRLVRVGGRAPLGPGALLLLAERDVISSYLADRLLKAKGFRNILVHDYVAIDPDLLVQHLRHDAEDLHAFARHLAQHLRDGVEGSSDSGVMPR